MIYEIKNVDILTIKSKDILLISKKSHLTDSIPHSIEKIDFETG
jgi:hypothetical protein